MSYYTGDYYRGDPGFFSAARGLLSAGASFIPGVGGTLSRVIAGSPGGLTGGLMKAIPAAGGKIIKAAKMHPGLTAAGVAGVIAVAGAGAGAERMLTGGLPPKGYHVIKKGPHAGRLTRNRRMRVTNSRALRRAIRRATGFAHLAKRVLHFTSPRAPKGRAIFRKRARKK